MMKTTMASHSHTIHDIGFVMPKLLNNDKYNNILGIIKRLIDHNLNRHICVFSSYNERIDTYNVPILHLNESKFFYGNLFLFDITSIILTNKYPNIHARYWYADTMPWTDHQNGFYHEWQDIFMSSNLKIIAANQMLHDLYSLCWKEPISIMETLDHESIAKII